MPVIEPFRALRYDPTKVGDLSRVAAPPYDVIDPALQAELLAEPYNILHLDLAEGSTDANDPENRYRRAAHQLGEWRDLGVLRRDAAPALYAYEQSFEWEGTLYTRRSFICRARVDGDFRPHEQTFSGPKEDRFRLTVETRCNLSQVLGVYSDPNAEVIGLLEPALQREPDLEAVGLAGDCNRMWVVSDPPLVSAVCAAMQPRTVFIADGHHRFETAKRYRDYLAKLDTLDLDHPAQYTTVALVGSADEGLRVRPTHRVVRGWQQLSVDALRQAVDPLFESRELPLDPTDGTALDHWFDIADLSAVGVLLDGHVLLLTPREPGLAKPGASAALAGLNVTVLHDQLLPQCLTAAFGEPELSYVHRASEAVEAVAGGASAAFLLRACPLQTMLDIAGGGELMPQKSTYFYPKLMTGLVLYPLTGA